MQRQYRLIFLACLLVISPLLVHSSESGWQVMPKAPVPDYRSRIPNMKQFNGANIQQRLDYVAKGNPVVRIRRMFDVTSLGDFTAGERAVEWAKRQPQNPSAIVISGGRVSLDQVLSSLGKQRFLTLESSGVYLLRVPLVVEKGATLELTGATVKQLRLSKEGGAFLSNSGNLFVIDSSVVAWSEVRQAEDVFEADAQFRPFLVSWEGAEIYSFRSEFVSLGYNKSKSYGITLSRYTTSTAKQLAERLAEPTGWFIESTFRDVYYGFYCYEAKDVVLYKNTYKDNVVYGIDPHDRSEHLMIVENEVFGTKKKHGIIISREVNDSWIIGNRTHHNKLSGIVLDRASVGNIVADNKVFENGSDGITLYESGDNAILDNDIYANGHHGVRIRNSFGVELLRNSITANGRVGVEGAIDKLEGLERDNVLDKFETRVGVSIFGGVIAANGSGSLRFKTADYLMLQSVKLKFPQKRNNIQLGKGLDKGTSLLISTMARDEHSIAFRAKPDLKPKAERGH